MKEERFSFEIETGTDTMLSVQIQKSKEYSNSEVVRVRNEAILLMSQYIGLDEDGVMVTSLTEEQLDNFIGKLAVLRVELKRRNKELKKQLENSSTRGHVIVEAERLADEYNNQMLKKIIGYYSNLSDDEIKKDFEDGKYDSILSPNAYRKLQTYVNNKR